MQPKHVITPMGAWNFFRDIQPPKERERDAHITCTEHDGLETLQTSTADGALVLMPDDLVTDVHREHATGTLTLHVTRPILKPILIDHELRDAAYRSTVVHVAPGASCTIVERLSGKSPYTSHTVEIHAGENSHCTHGAFNELRGVSITRKRAAVARDATVHWFELDTGKGASYSRIASDLQGAQAATKIATIFLGRDDDCVDVGAAVTHSAPHTYSDLFTRGVLAGSARGTYEGEICIEEDAAASSAFQEENSLLLSSETEMRASPMLYINNNDVRCSHAATSSRLDQQLLFYLRARGIPRAEAEHLVMRAFVWPVLERLDGDSRNILMTQSEPYIERYHG